MLHKRPPLLADGGTGTTLQGLGLAVGEAPERWTLDRPDAIATLARTFATAGSDLVYTNTFGANRIRLERCGLADKVRELNLQAVSYARNGVASAKRTNHTQLPFVVGSIGPTGEILEPYGDLHPAAARDAFAEQAAALSEAGVDGIICETFADLQEALLCFEAVRTKISVPIVVSMAFETNGHTMMGVTPEDAVTQIWDAGAAVVGVNCSVGPDVVETAIRAMKTKCPQARLLAKPNAGIPQVVDGKAVYSVTPQDMAGFARRMKSLGVSIVGGCCGTTTEHITAMAEALHE